MAVSFLFFATATIQVRASRKKPYARADICLVNQGPGVSGNRPSKYPVHAVASATMATPRLEELRFLHEDIERLEHAISERYAENPKNVRLSPPTTQAPVHRP